MKNIVSVKYMKDIFDSSDDNIGIEVVCDEGRLSVPLDPANRHYAEIMRQVEAGELTIQEAGE